MLTRAASFSHQGGLNGGGVTKTLVRPDRTKGARRVWVQGMRRQSWSARALQ